jgi:serine/threonine protein kinase
MLIHLSKTTLSPLFSPPFFLLLLYSMSLGTPAFLAPECCQIGEFHTKRADIWAAGISMYYMLFGAVPFVDNAETLSIAGQMRSIVEQPLVFPQGHSVSSQALQLLTQLLEKDPERRILLDSALLSPWITADQNNLLRQPSLKRLPSGLPDNEILPVASAEDLRRAVINVSNWVLVVKVKQIASRHVQNFRERRKSQDDFVGAGSLSNTGEQSVATSSSTL